MWRWLAWLRRCSACGRRPAYPYMGATFQGKRKRLCIRHGGMFDLALLNRERRRRAHLRLRR